MPFSLPSSVLGLLVVGLAVGQDSNAVHARGGAVGRPAGRLPIETMLQNEIQAVRGLRALAIAQMQCRAMASIDVDGDGRGEFGTLGELAATHKIRDRFGKPTRGLMSPPILTAEWGQVDQGLVYRDGYCFAIYLPGSDWSAFSESPSGGSCAPGPWPNGAEERWTCYAWPQRYGVTGELAFCIDQDGGIAATSNRRRRYSGLTNRPAFDAARWVDSASSEDGTTAERATPVDFRTPLAFARDASDGQFWRFYDISFAEHRHARAGNLDRELVPTTVARLDAGPREAIPAELRRIVSAQMQCRARNLIDTDRDGAGEFGFFAELAGSKPVRTARGAGTETMFPIMLGRGFGVVEDRTVVYRGYCFRMVLPGRDGEPLLEAGFGAVLDGLELQPDADLAEQQFYCYAWPLEFGLTGRAAYAVDSDGRILITDNEARRYSGIDRAPEPCAAFRERGQATRPLAPIRVASDGSAWLDQEAASPPR